MFLRKLTVSLVRKTLVHHDGCHHRGMDHAVVGIGARLGKGEANAAAGEDRRIEGPLVRRDGMGHAIMVRPGHLGTHFDGEAIGGEREVPNRDAVPAAAGGGRRWSRRWVCRRGSGRSDGRRWGSGRSGGRRRARPCGGRRTATGCQEHKQAHSQQAQPGFCGGRCRCLLHVSSSSAMLLHAHTEDFLSP